MQMVTLAGGMLEEKPPPRELPSHQLTILRIYGSLFFAAAKNLEEMLPSVDNTYRAVVILRLRGHQETGSTFVNVLRKYAQDLKARDSKLMLVGVDAEVHNQLRKTETTAVICEENIFRATPRLTEALTGAVAAAHAWLADRSGNKPHRG